MTLPFDGRHLPAPLALFVMVHPNRSGRGLSLADSEAAGVLLRCRAALMHARGMNMAVAFLAAWPPTVRGDLRWISGLKPGGRDMVFERTARSCYASQYFAEAADNYHALVIAGFLDAQDCVATVIDALRVGHNTIFLRDAITGARCENALLGNLRNFTNRSIAVRDTDAWKDATGFLPTEVTATRDMRTIFPFPPTPRSAP